MADTFSRFARQHALKVIGPQGQKRLLETTVAIVGCGALGSAQANLLVRAGIGKLILIDHDTVQAVDLHRQILFDQRDVIEEMPKVLAAKRRLNAIDPQTEILAFHTRFSPQNALELVAEADLILDGTDNFPTRFLINEAAIITGIPWIFGGVLSVQGSVMTVLPNQGPCLCCLVPKAPDCNKLPTCKSDGVLNAAVMWVASLQVAKATKLILGHTNEQVLLHGLDVWEGTVRTIQISKNPDCPCCVHKNFQFLQPPLH